MAGELGLRVRSDLILKDGKIGFYKTGVRELLDVESCVQMDRRLQEFYKDFRKNLPEIEGAGSVRLRISPAGDRGAWLDFANLDVKRVLEEKKWIQWLFEMAFVEIGQRKKKVIFKNGEPKLGDPQLHSWFETYNSGGAIALYGLVGGFSQPSFKANKILVETVLAAAKKSATDRWVELFCGNGNFSAALASEGLSVVAVENDFWALEGLDRTIKENKLNIEIRKIDLYSKKAFDELILGEGLLVDPPRSGLGIVLEKLSHLGPNERPKNLIYVSCYEESLKNDTARLLEMGYEISEVTGVDQFTFSPLCEWVVTFCRR